MINMHAAIGAV